MNAIIEFHHDWAWVVVFSNGLVGLWSLAAHWFAPPRRKTLWFAVGAAEVAVFVQVVLGVTMVAGGRTEPAPFERTCISSTALARFSSWALEYGHFC